MMLPDRFFDDIFDLDAPRMHPQKERMDCDIYEEDGKYVVDFEKAAEVINSWSELIIRTQATGDVEFASAYSKENAAITPALEADIKKVNEAGIPRDITFNWAW